MQQKVQEIRYRKSSNSLLVTFADGASFALPAEYLRVFSPSAEVRGHGLQEPLLVIGKEQVRIRAIEPVGRYAVKLVFDDGHDSGLYDWDILRKLAEEQEHNWTGYLARLRNAGVPHPSETDGHG
ncbi:MAG: gamma-butyrobetaine hydroxylase-like domain-containing protein [Halothiobacillaceae bacterium]